MIDRGDIDIDVVDRDRALGDLPRVHASIIRDGKITKHNTGVYFHGMPIDPVTGLSSIGYDLAEQKGCFKFDVLNVSVYGMVRDEEHLIDLMHREIDWKIFEQREFVGKLFHLNNHAELTAKLKPKSIDHIAMILALIRPGKKHLQSKCLQLGFDSIRKEIWYHAEEDGYTFKKSHAVGYAMLVYVHANLLIEQAPSAVDSL